MRYMILLLPALILIACGGASAPPIDQVSAALTGAGATDIREEPLEAGAPVPRSFAAHRVFTLAPVAPKGGQYFVCDTARNCDAIYAYYDALKALAGPYTYRGKSGLVVVQLNSGLTPEQAAPFERAMEGL